MEGLPDMSCPCDASTSEQCALLCHKFVMEGERRDADHHDDQ
jgi:hypothetical protein